MFSAYNKKYKEFAIPVRWKEAHGNITNRDNPVGALAQGKIMSSALTNGTDLQNTFVG